MTTSHKPSEARSPHDERMHVIKNQLRQKMVEDRVHEETKAEEARRLAQEEEKRLVEEKARIADEERIKKEQKPWRQAGFRPKAQEGDEPSDKTEEQGVESSLEAIYMEKDGEVADLAHLERKRSGHWLWFFGGGLALIVLVGSLAWAGLLLLQPYREFQGDGLTLAVSGPDQVTLGQEETYTIDWTNASIQPLSDASIRLSFPADFTVTSMTPEPTNKVQKRFDFGLVDGKAHGQIIAKGMFVGALGTQNTVQALGTFRPTNFRRDYDVVAVENVTYSKTVLDGRLELPAKVLSGDVVNLTYFLENKGGSTLSDLSVRLHLPAGFVVNPSSLPLKSAVKDSDVIVPLPALLSGISGTIQLSGTFTAGMSGDMVFGAEAGRTSDDGTFLAIQKTETKVPVLGGDLALHAVVNGADTDRSIKPGEPLRLALDYQNTSPETLKGVTLTVQWESAVVTTSTKWSSLLDWVHADNALNGTTSTKDHVQTMVFDKKQIPSLDNLTSQGEGTIEVTVPTLPAPRGATDASVRLTIQADVAMVGNSKVRRTIRTAPMTFRYRSDVTSIAEAREFTEEGAPLGFGPLPPIVGKTTSYRVFWRVQKTLHPLENIVMSAVLPRSVEKGSMSLADLGEFKYDGDSRTISWLIPKMPEDRNSVEASFDVILTPDPLDVGRFANLLSETKFQAQDTIVNELLGEIKPQITTDLQNDDGARGKGVVREK